MRAYTADLLERFAHLSPAWLRDAELSLSSHDPERRGFQTRFEHASELGAFLGEMGLDAAPFLENDARVREKFLVTAPLWAKVNFQGKTAVEASQYFLLPQYCHYPITTLRVFARRFGEGVSPLLEVLLRFPLEEQETHWGIALKAASQGRKAVAFCRTSRDVLRRVLTGMETRGLLPPHHAEKYLDLTGVVGGHPLVYLTVDLAHPSDLAVDVEDPTIDLDTVPAELLPAGTRPRYLKCRLKNDGVRWTAYYPWTALATEETSASYLQSIRDYYRRTHEDYLACVGPTLQAALVADTAPASNLRLAERAGLRAGMRILDAGCGVCGPAIDIAAALDVTIDGVTLSESQVDTARQRIHDSGLTDRVHAHLADFHALPMEDRTFDAVILLESSCYSYAPDVLFAELYRVLKAGGTIFIKDFFLRSGAMSAEQTRALQDYDFTYRTRTRPLSNVMQAIEHAGFHDVHGKPLEGASLQRYNQAMVSSPREGTVTAAFMMESASTPQLSRFGRYHRRSWQNLPVDPFEIAARKPLQ